MAKQPYQTEPADAFCCFAVKNQAKNKDAESVKNLLEVQLENAADRLSALQQLGDTIQ